MRITGGSAKGRKVGSRKAFIAKGESEELRPTAAKVRQAIFNILTGKIEGSRFVDLYAGTGAVGIEALSRGAGHVVFVEESHDRVRIIKNLVEKFGFIRRASVVKARAISFLNKSPQGSFDIIFLDPPYATDELALSLPVIDESLLLRKDGCVIAEHSSKKIMNYPLKNLRVKKIYRYGDTTMTLYEYPRSEDNPVTVEKEQSTTRG
jgi:16S rRNA (guanine966-N2)-methyltransferase